MRQKKIYPKIEQISFQQFTNSKLDIQNLPALKRLVIDSTAFSTTLDPCKYLTVTGEVDGLFKNISVRTNGDKPIDCIVSRLYIFRIRVNTNELLL